jgi:hypothetical protein
MKEQVCSIDNLVGKERDLLADYWDAVSALDADLVSEHFAAHSVLSLDDRPAARGRPAIRRLFVRLFGSVQAIRRTPVASWSDSGLVVDEADVTFVLEDGSAATVPITTMLWTTSYGIGVCRISLYPEPALARATGVSLFARPVATDPFRKELPF